MLKNGNSFTFSCPKHFCFLSVSSRKPTRLLPQAFFSFLLLMDPNNSSPKPFVTASVGILHLLYLLEPILRPPLLIIPKLFGPTPSAFLVNFSLSFSYRLSSFAWNFRISYQPQIVELPSFSRTVLWRLHCFRWLFLLCSPVPYLCWHGCPRFWLIASFRVQPYAWPLPRTCLCFPFFIIK